MDSVQKALKIKESCIFTDLDEAIGALKLLQTIQKKHVIDKGSAKAPKICVVCDDCIGHRNFMKSDELVDMFIKSRHYNITVFFLSQYYKKLPPVCRNQATTLMFFAVSASEADCIAEMFAPPNMPTNNFKRMIADCVDAPYQFLTVAKKSPWAQRFRQGLGMSIDLNFYRGASDKNKILLEQTNNKKDGQTLSNTNQGGDVTDKRKRGEEPASTTKSKVGRV
jgi:hypothetical protein